MAKNYEELRLSDDFMFGKVMEDSGLCREVLECLRRGRVIGKMQALYRYIIPGGGSNRRKEVLDILGWLG